MLRTCNLIVLATLFLLVSGCKEQPNNTPAEDSAFLLEVGECLIKGRNDRLEVITWNVERFPLSPRYTIRELVKMIEGLDADVIALQEITNETDFNELVSALPGWEGILYKQSDLNLAYLYKISDITSVVDHFPILTDNFYAFPRAPYQAEFSHTSGLNFTLINLHLKCCGGEENELRREEASQLLKAYLDENLAEEPVIVLGDYNDLIVDERNVFENFINDSLNYRFLDMEIARGNGVDWSYPSFPSHIDHILITDELFDLATGAETVTIDLCDDRYFDIISDHRPVVGYIEP